MRTKGQHLTRSDRDMIERFNNIDHFSTRQIADLLHVHWNTINNELKRGFYEHENYDYIFTVKYSANKAQQDYDYQKTAKGPEIKLGYNKQIAKYIVFLIKRQRYSHYAALERVKKKFECEQPFCVRTLYSYIEKGYLDGLSVKDLPEQGKRRNRLKRRRKQ